METTLDLARQPNPQSNDSSAPPPVEAWTYPVRPAWIHDLLDLWERNRLLVQYLEMATDRIAQDIPGANTRRHTLYQITRCFVPVTGGGRRSRTASPNPWAAYSQLYATELLAPAYLVHLVAANDMVNAAAALLHQGFQAGDLVDLRDVRQHLVETFGDRPSARKSAGPVLRTLTHFGVLRATASAVEYHYAKRLSVDLDAFPLLIWAWWQVRQTRVIRIPELAFDELLTFIDHASYAAYWAEYEGSLWAVEVRDGIECAVLHCADASAFIRTMFNLLSSHPKWPTVNRQHPEP